MQYACCSQPCVMQPTVRSTYIFTIVNYGQKRAGGSPDAHQEPPYSAGVIKGFWTLLLEIRNWEERKWGQSIYSNTVLQWSLMWINVRPCLRTLSSLGVSHPFSSFQTQTIQSIVFRPCPCSSHFQEIILREKTGRPAGWDSHTGAAALPRSTSSTCYRHTLLSANLSFLELTLELLVQNPTKLWGCAHQLLIFRIDFIHFWERCTLSPIAAF